MARSENSSTFGSGESDIGSHPTRSQIFSSWHAWVIFTRLERVELESSDSWRTSIQLAENDISQIDVLVYGYHVISMDQFIPSPVCYSVPSSPHVPRSLQSTILPCSVATKCEHALSRFLVRLLSVDLVSRCWLASSIPPRPSLLAKRERFRPPRRSNWLRKRVRERRRSANMSMTQIKCRFKMPLLSYG